MNVCVCLMGVGHMYAIALRSGQLCLYVGSEVPIQVLMLVLERPLSHGVMLLPLILEC